MEVIDEKVIEILKEAVAFAKPAQKRLISTMSLDSSMSDLGIESIAALEMAGYVEEKLGIQFPDDELTSVQTLRGFAKLVQQYAPAI
jgi:acyl carrier protein